VIVAATCQHVRLLMIGSWNTLRWKLGGLSPSSLGDPISAVAAFVLEHAFADRSMEKPTLIGVRIWGQRRSTRSTIVRFRGRHVGDGDAMLKVRCQRIDQSQDGLHKTLINKASPFETHLEQTLALTHRSLQQVQKAQTLQPQQSSQ
jgi:hypothetical protein